MMERRPYWMSHPDGGGGGARRALFHVVVRLHSVISKRQNRGGVGWGGGDVSAWLRLMRFLSKRFTAGVFGDAHQSRLRAPTAAKQSLW